MNSKDSVMIVAIDENEYNHLGVLLEEMFPEAKIQMVSVVINPNGKKEFEGTPRQVITPEVLRIVFDVESVLFSHPVFHTQICLPYDLCRHPSKDTL